MSVWDAPRNPSFFTNPAEADPINEGARAILNGKQVFDDSSPRFEDWSPDKQRAVVEGLQRADSNRIEQRANAAAFLVLHPEFLDIDPNGETMNRTLEALYGDRVYTVSEFEKAYEVCRANNSLTLDEAEIVKQQQAAANAQRKAVVKTRQEQERVRNLSEDEMSTLPLDEVRKQANRQLQEDMQKSGESQRWGSDW